MNDPGAAACSRTPAVLAIHLDGDLQGARAETGYDFVSDDCLHAHLRECGVCQQLLRRARRLDAALASSAGRAIADHSTATGESFDAFADRLLERAVTSTPSTPLPSMPSPSTSSLPTVSPSKVAEPSRPWTLLAAGALLAAAAATWLLLIAPIAADQPNQPNQPGNHNATADTFATPRVAVGDVPTSDAPTSGAPTNDEPEVAAAPADDGASLPLRLARHLHDRARPEQVTLSHEQLGRRLADAALPMAARLSAGRRLLDAASSPAARAYPALDALVEGLASLGDASEAELALQDELLDRVRSSSAMRGRLTTRVHDLAAADDDTMTRRDVAALVVAARAGDERLDAALRRAMRERVAIAQIATSALRSAARADGGAGLLLLAWQDRVTACDQENTPRWAEFWFRGQSHATFCQLAERLQQSRSMSERIRCLLAMGCAGDDATLAALRAHLDSPSQQEAHAAACALAALPHRVLAPLLPEAGRADAALLRAALARAGLPQTRPWLAGLTQAQRRLLLEARPEQLAAVAGWFRGRSEIAD